ncbi:phosphoenolpyruvate synthase [Actinoplanes sp. ATCC 53533]|uniref:PEP/pyruvate-binding domain-containing protein n=1 Tax=Actinoplanes sp. ATCC 53533 TaxID=1288362 RepID=UPI000F7806B5|nr:PEP/pyruvate-binding domain-containing protein [Actinoplanes sp. ATCC 53533]RSM68227.1 phosphoenolpyruvate synthase [Actinoplanes sp. ATCC 53533]
MATATPSRLVMDLTEVDAAMPATAGGKAANLGEMIRAGLPVPPGLCVTTDAYRLTVAGTALGEVLRELAAAAADDVAALTALAGRARAALLAAPVPAAVTTAVTAAYARLGTEVPVAVRSSATAEDLPSASFAGQQDTYLNVVGTASVIDAVARCWASLWTDRAVVYRAANGIDHRTVHLAVVIQRMVDARVAGVLFTADPVTGRRRQAVIDAAPGLGEAVVSGAVNPDHFVVDTATGDILDRRLGDKRVAVRARPGGGVERVTAGDATATACISDDRVRELAALGDRVEAHYGAPQDTEWAVDAGGTLWLTQTRPVTTLYPVPDPVPDGLRVYFCFSVAQGLFRPITPMGVAALRLLGTSAAREFGFAVADPLAGPAVLLAPGQRIFVDCTDAVRSRVGRFAIPRVLGVMEARSAVVMRRLFDDPRLSITHRSVRPFLRRAARFAVRHRLPVRLIHGIAAPDALHRDLERLPAEIRRRLSLPADATPAVRLDLVEHALATDVFPLAPRAMAPAAGGFALLGLAGKLARSRPGELQTVLRGLPHNVTTTMDLDLWQLARAIRRDAAATALLLTTPLTTLADRWRDGELPAPVQAGLTGFLDRYGERAVAEIDLGVPRWSDDPRHVIGVVLNYLRLDDDRAAPDAVFARGAAEAGRMVSTLVDRSGAIRRPLVRFALDRARRLAGVRELPKYLLIVAFAQLRAQLRLVGQALAADARIAAPADIFMLTTAEARAGLSGRDLHDLVADRRAGYDTELRRRGVPRVLLSDGTEPEASAGAAAAPDGALVGTPASAGTITATARLVLDPVGARLEPGEILVAPSTDPGWTPLFLTAGGLIMEMGGANSHGAVVAREYGIPAVVGVPDATTRIATGDLITLDGTAGTVLKALG